MVSDFFRGQSGRLSMTRLLTFLSFIPATYELVRINNEAALGLYLGAYVVGYIGGKFGEGRFSSQRSQ